MCGMWFINDIVIDDINWFEIMLVLMIILIWDDVVIDDNNWYEMTLVFMIILIWDDMVIDDNTDMRWCCYC